MQRLPYDLITLISRFLSGIEKERVRTLCKDFCSSIKMMDIKVCKMEDKIDNILDGRVYILNRLRLAALCGLEKEKISYIWYWINNNNLIKDDSLPILGIINNVIR